MKTLIVLFLVVINNVVCDVGVWNYKSQLAIRSPAASTPNPNVCYEKGYRPKSDTELSGMSPRQLVDEALRVNPGSFDSYSALAQYEISINKYIRKAGIDVLPVLADDMKSYDPKLASDCNTARFDFASRTAGDIDRFVVRLRGTKEGLLAIEAFERANVRIKENAPRPDDNRPNYLGNHLEELKGVNEVDRSIRDTFWVLHKIKMSDIELIEFSDFLIARDPTYPSWSERHLIKDYTRTDEGVPLQVFVLTKPERYYDTYMEFKKVKRG